MFLSLLALLVFAPSALAGTSISNGAYLSITGDSGPNDVTIDYSEGLSAYVLTIFGGIDLADGCDVVSPTQLICPRVEQGGQFHIDAGDSDGGGEGMGAGNDSVKVGYGSDNVYPGNPADPFTTAPDTVLVELGSGDDFFGGSEVTDRALGQDGNDVLDGAEGIDQLVAGNYAEDVPTEGFDKLFGGPGSDDLVEGDSTSSHGTDLLDGGACVNTDHPSCPTSPSAEARGDRDTVWYHARTGDVTLNLANQAASQGESGEDDTVRNVESASTGAGDDTVTGSAAFNTILTDFQTDNDGKDTVDVSGDPGRADEVVCGGGIDTLTADTDDQELGCDTVTRIDDGGGSSGPSPGTPLPGPPVPRPPEPPSAGSGNTTGGSTGGPTFDRLIASVAQELAQAGRTLGRCGTTGLLKKSGCRDSFTALAPGTVAYRVTAPAADAGATAVAVIASGKRAITAAGNYPVRVKATKKGRKRLRRARKLRATLTVTFTDSTGNVAKRSKKVVLKRKNH